MLSIQSKWTATSIENSIINLQRLEIIFVRMENQIKRFEAR